MNSNSKVILGVIAAAAAGVLIGMLMSPEKGSTIRKNIKDGIGDLGDKVNDLINEGKNKVQGVANELKSDITSLKDDTVTTAQHAKKIVS